MRALLVTGASRGLGRHIAERAAAEGYQVVGLARQPTEVAGVEIVACDVGDAREVDEVCKRLKGLPLYGIINAAGIASMNLLLTTPVETIERLVRTNLTGTILVCRAAAKQLVRRKQGRIINFSTIAVPLGLKGEAVYVATKAGVEGFSRSFAREMSDHGVTVNVIAPGPIDTDLIRKIPAEKIQEIVNRQISQSMAVPEDVWNVVSLLLADESRTITGTVINIAGV